MSYYRDYPTRPMGGGNPYYCCASCGVTDPQINGTLEGHRSDCEWAKQKKIELGISSDLVCPFCREEGFDLSGLKRHLLSYCAEFDEMEPAT